jgi:ABC-type nitrate/sulfonate/bicarbonate transport system permease component
VTATAVEDVSEVQAPRRRDPEARRRARQRSLRGLAGIVLFFAIWQVLFELHQLNPLFIGSPSGMARSLWRLLGEGSFWSQLRESGIEFVLGFGFGALGGVLLGVLIGWFSLLDDVLDPLIAAFYATPYVAFLPLIVVWVGIGLWAKVVIVVWAAFFAVLINTIAGVKNTPPDYLRAADAFCVGRVRTLRTVVLPAAVPYILAGLRQSIGRSLVGVIVAEFYLASKGIGFFITTTTNNFEANDAFAAIFITAIVGLALVRGVGIVERRVGRRWGLTTKS